MSNPIPAPTAPAPAPAALPRRRHPLGLPAGSIRALLAIMVLALLWAVVYLHKNGEKIPVLYVYLQYLMILILAHFFAAHGNTISNYQLGDRSPLWLPRGSVRLGLLIGFVAVIVWMHLNRPEFEQDLPQVSGKLPLLLLAAFLLGLTVSFAVLRPLAARGGVPAWLQDIQAWFALMCMIGLTVLLLWHVFVRPSLPEPHEAAGLEAYLAAMVGFYFGARS